MLANQILHGNHIYLRDIQLNDCTERYLSWLNNPAVNQYLETRWSKQTLDTISDFVNKIRTSSDNILFAIVDCETNSHIGNIKLGPININNSNADISYFIGETMFWNRGYATEAVCLVTSYAFKEKGLHRVRGGCIEHNGASDKVFRKLGFKHEGKLIEAYYVNGEYLSASQYYLLNTSTKL